MKEKEARFCKCGRIHIIEEDLIFSGAKEGKETILICANCGEITRIGLEDYGDQGYCQGCCAYSISVKDSFVFRPQDEKSKEELSMISKVIYSHGIKVPMMTGEYANTRFCHNFIDSSSASGILIGDLSKSIMLSESKDEVMKKVQNVLEDYEEKRRTVDMARLVRETSEDDLKVLKQYAISQFDWSQVE